MDIILSVSILWSLVILFWRNTWKLFDLNLYPDDKTKTLIWSAVISIGVQIFIEIVSLLFEANVKKLKTIHYFISLIIQDIFFTIAGIGNVAMWRTYWILVDMLIEMSGSDIGLPCICVGSFIILACTCSCRSGGLLMDGDLRNWYQLPNDIIGSIKYVKVRLKKVKSQKYWTPRKIQNGKSLIKRQNQKRKHIKLMDNNCYIPDLVYAFSYVENGGLSLVL